jgi:peptide/nickel transport system permease protein
MRSYIASRLGWGALVVGAIVVVTFFITHGLPGDPVQALVGDYPAPQAFVDEVRAQYGLDRPLPVQFLLYIEQLVQGNLGYSFAGQQAVLPLILGRALFTLLLMIPSLVIASVLGVVLAVAAARRAGTAYDAAIAGVSLFGYSVPVFWLGQVLIVLFAITFSVLPAQGMTSSFGSSTAAGVVVDVLRHSVLPVFSLVIYYIATVARVGRSSVYDALQQDFVLTARAKGLSMRRVMWTHVLPSAMGPIITVVGYQFAYALTGAILVETVFAWPGIGTLFVASISKRDQPVLEGIFLLAALSVVAVNLLTDIVHTLADPRVRASVSTHG